MTELDIVDQRDHESNGRTAGDDGAFGKRIALVGRFGGMNQREAGNVLRSYGASIVDTDASGIDWVIVGAEESPLVEAEILGRDIVEAAAVGDLEIIREMELWQRIGLVEMEQSARRFHTPAMLAHLLGVSVRVIRRWHRRGLITPTHTLHKLPYFDFQEVASARRLAEWVASGASPKAIEQRLVELVEVLPHMSRPLHQLSILVEGKQVLLRGGEGLLEPGGQLRFDFDALESTPDGESSLDDATEPILLSIANNGNADHVPNDDRDELLDAAFQAEDDGNYESAVSYFHAIIARDGPRSDIDFQLAELLYRMGHVIAARERYYAAIEQDPDFVEARASLGNVLAETGQTELAIAAYRGALSLYGDYADVHYNLARTLDDLGRDIEAKHHWEKFLRLSPDSPWADEAEQRLR